MTPAAMELCTGLYSIGSPLPYFQQISDGFKSTACLASTFEAFKICRSAVIAMEAK